MQRGRIVEEGETESIFRAPKHPYTQTLLKSILAPRPRDAGDYAFAPQDAPYPMGSTSRYL
jgi:oligopeptide/dipeptide ABC transporter ATP-binding protein